jgi:Ca-activated chloride channel family protein
MQTTHRSRRLVLLPTLLALGLQLSGCDKAEIERQSDSRSDRKMEERHPEMARAAAESYAPIHESPFEPASDVSTFAIDVDTASYSNVRRFLEMGSKPPADAVRIEELINYFDYDYAEPREGLPFAVVQEVSDCPWNADARLVHIGLQAERIELDELPARNLVFLLDVSGSMNASDKLPLLKNAMRMMVDTLDQDDRVAIVVYAGASGVVLDPTAGSEKQAILDALERLEAGGSTNGGAGIARAYALARENFEPGAINRVILATDGDFNVGTTSHDELEAMIARERESGVFLSVLGFGTGNLGDATMELLADKGNGNYAYLDSLDEARKVLVDEAGATMLTVARDVKVQVEFDPAQVERYRLIGYENRALADEDFADDRKDAGEIGAGHAVTALYEIIPAAQAHTNEAELGQLRLRWQPPQGGQSQLLSVPLVDHGTPLVRSSDDFRFAAAVAEFGLLLRDSDHRGAAEWPQVLELASHALGQDRGGLRHEFLELAGKASEL